MCLMCDGATYEESLAYMARIVTEQGWAIQGVERDRDHPPWAYTVGLTEYGVPELVATGLRLPRAAELLNGVAAHALHATAPMPGEQVPLVGGPLVEFVELPHPDAHLHTAVQLYGSDIRVRKPCERPDRCGARARGV
ncbi:MAG: DUF4262 domain-containing protein [Actinomycetota bacterium]|nr:DUF4262 domain-containing protein [Actinomycetota bacterium]